MMEGPWTIRASIEFLVMTESVHYTLSPVSGSKPRSARWPGPSPKGDQSGARFQEERTR